MQYCKIFEEFISAQVNSCMEPKPVKYFVGFSRSNNTQQPLLRMMRT